MQSTNYQLTKTMPYKTKQKKNVNFKAKILLW